MNAINADAQIGELLARDPDPRVRRAFAEALARTPPTPRTDTARETLRADPRHSVRRLLPPASGSVPPADG